MFLQKELKKAAQYLMSIIPYINIFESFLCRLRQGASQEDKIRALQEDLNMSKDRHQNSLDEVGSILPLFVLVLLWIVV